jgi:hypothetical protein
MQHPSDTVRFSRLVFVRELKLLRRDFSSVNVVLIVVTCGSYHHVSLLVNGLHTQQGLM